jgi:hypothetical protein
MAENLDTTKAASILATRGIYRMLLSQERKKTYQPLMDIEVWGCYDCILDVVLMDSKHQM